MQRNAPLLLRQIAAPPPIHATTLLLRYSLSTAVSTPPPWPPVDGLLLRSSAARSLNQTQQAHASALLSGLLPHSISVSAALMLRYAAFGRSDAYRLLFDQIPPPRRTAFLCNTLIRAKSVAGDRDSGFEVYNWMCRNGVRPDYHTFPFVFKVCADCSELQKGLEVHGTVFKLGFDSDVYVGNTLLRFYGSCGDVRHAEKVFDEMPERDVVSWNTIFGVLSLSGLFSNALDLFREMKLAYGVKPNEVSVVNLLPICAELQDEVTASEIHCYVLKVGFDVKVSIGNALVDAYGKCGNVKACRKVFDEMIERNAVSWNSIIASLAHGNLNKDSLNMFRSMIDSGEMPDSITLSSVLPTLVELEFFKLGKEIHGYSVRKGVEPDIFIANSLVDMYAKSGHCAQALNVFCKIDAKTVVSWNAMVANFARNGLELESLGVVRQMQAQGQTPNSVTLTNVLPACARAGFLRPGKEIHAKSIRTGLSFHLFVSNALIDMYTKCCCLNLAKSVFNISLQDEVTYNILVVGYSQTSHCIESLHLFSEMGLMGMKYDVVSFVGVLSACANLAAIKQGKEIHGFAVRNLFHLHLFIANSLLDFYTKCDQIDIAQKMFDRMLKKDISSWNIMILAYGMLGQVEIAINLFEAVRKNGVEYDSVSYIAVLTACSHGGLVEKGKLYFDEMFNQKIKPTHMHYACMVDLLGRAGHLEEAAEFIRGLPIVPDSSIWGAMLGTCRNYGNIELGSWAAEHLFKLKPENPGYYLLLSNMYADAGKWDEAKRIRELMKLRKVKKNSGCSWLRTHDQEHAFVVGERINGLDSGLWPAGSA